jgi:hypothetical protein
MEVGSTALLASFYFSVMTPTVSDKAPLHMDAASRNERLYETLLKMGLYVEPIPDKEGRIYHFIVSVDYAPPRIEQSQG